jgi:predicted amidophosphoribosyltransferase
MTQLPPRRSRRANRLSAKSSSASDPEKPTHWDPHLRAHLQAGICERCGSNQHVHEALCRRCRKTLMGEGRVLGTEHEGHPSEADAMRRWRVPWLRRGA